MGLLRQFIADFHKAYEAKKRQRRLYKQLGHFLDTWYAYSRGPFRSR